MNSYKSERFEIKIDIPDGNMMLENINNTFSQNTDNIFIQNNIKKTSTK